MRGESKVKRSEIKVNGIFYDGVEVVIKPPWKSFILPKLLAVKVSTQQDSVYFRIEKIVAEGFTEVCQNSLAIFPEVIESGTRHDVELVFKVLDSHFGFEGFFRCQTCLFKKSTIPRKRVNVECIVRTDNGRVTSRSAISDSNQNGVHFVFL